MKQNTPRNTSWQKVGDWYDAIVGESGHYYHKNVVMPGVIKLLDLKKTDSLLDLACGQGVLSRHIAPQVSYTGIDSAKSLIEKAKSYATKEKTRTFLHSDVTEPLPIKEKFSHAAIVLALQNISAPEKVFTALAPHLEKDAQFVLVLNHPSFRIPRQSSWGFEEASKTQVRKISSYMSSQKIPITSKNQETTWSFHEPLSFYIQALFKAGFVVETMEEWCSDKESTGKAKKWENRARKEFPLFLAMRARFIRCSADQVS